MLAPTACTLMVIVLLILNSPHNHNRAVFVADVVALVVVQNTVIHSFAVVSFYEIVMHLQLFDPSLITILQLRKSHSFPKARLGYKFSFTSALTTKSLFAP